MNLPPDAAAFEHVTVEHYQRSVGHERASSAESVQPCRDLREDSGAAMPVEHEARQLPVGGRHAFARARAQVDGLILIGQRQQGELCFGPRRP